MKVHKRLGSAGVGALLLMFSVGCALDAQTRPEQTFERTLVVDGAVNLDVRTGSGTVQFQSGPTGTVRVVGRIRGNELWPWQDVAARVKQIAGNPPIEQQGNTIRVGGMPNDQLFRNISISYEIIAPFDTRLRARSGSGSHTIGDLRGPVDVNTGSGDIRIGHIAGNVDALTGSGAVELQRADGVFAARTGSGTIQAMAVAGPVRANTGSGRIDVAQVSASPVDVEAGSGSISIRGARGALRARSGSGSIDVAGSPGQAWYVRTGSGDISLRLESQASFTLSATTGSGVIETTHPLSVVGQVSRRRLEGTVRGGGAKVDVFAGSGSIRVQ
jgi:DUF4097 and DUF4098 domain-containing protein YvlB